MTPEDITERLNEIVMIKHNAALKRLNALETFSDEWKKQASIISVLTDILSEFQALKENETKD